ncbi:RHS repeat-associated core domain-containing protein [Streptomyces sp. NPDC006632]|uniref:RHS repeat-associated core domain-containing protein n=1 Tax=Streptomyces sp. NPDC006632 TaxID=3157182 RepID=UPI0033A08011
MGLLTAWTLLLSGAPPALSLPQGIQVSSASGAARAKGAPKPTPAQKPMSLAERRKQVREDKSKAAQRTLGGPAGKNEQKPGAAPQAPKPRKQGKASSGIAAAATASIVRAEPDDFRVLGPEGSTRGVSQQWVGTSQWFSGQVFMGETITLSTAMLNSESKYVNGKYVDTPHQVKVTWKVSCGKDTTIDKGQTVTAPSTTYHYNNKTTPVPYVSTQVTLTPELCPNSMPGDSVYATGFTATAIGEVLDDSNPEPGDRTGKVTMRLLFAAPIPDASTDGCLTDCSLTGFAQPQTIRNGTVNTATGAFSLTSIDLTQAKVGGGWTAARHYSSQRAADGSSAAGSMGPGWSLPWESTFQHNKAARNAVFTSPTGSVHTYPYFVGGGGSCCDAPNTSRSDMSYLYNYNPYPIEIGYYITTPFNKRRLFFDLSGRLTHSMDVASNQGEAYTYNGDGRVSSIESWSGGPGSGGVTGRIATLNYTGGRLTRIERSDDSTVDYAYTDGLLTSVTSGGSTVSYGYDASSRLNSVKDGNGQEQIRNTFDGQGRVTGQTGPAGAVTSFAYNGGQTDTTMPDGGVWTDIYNSNHLIFEYDPFGNRNEYTYNGNSDVIRVTDDAGNVTSYTWSGSGPLEKITDASGTTKVHWNSYGITGVEYSGGSKPPTYGFDDKYRVISSKDALGNTSTFGYTAAGQLESETTPLGRATSYTYDSAGNRTSVTTPLGAKTTYTYNASGKPLTVTEPRGNVAGADPADFTTTYTYDANDRLASVKAPDGRTTTSNTYDTAGNLTKSTDAAGRATVFTYDTANRLTSTTAPGGAKSTLGYDSMGRVTARTDATGAKTTYTYDKAGRVLSMTTPRGNAEGADPAQHTWKYGYDKTGNQTTVTDPTGRTTKTDYDASSRPVAVTDPLGNVTKTSYDGDGKVVGTTDALGKSTSFVFDAANRLTSVKDPNGNTLAYAYDADGNRVSETSPLGFKTTYAYDADGRLTSRTEPRGNVAGANPEDFTWRTQYDVAGNTTAEIDPFGKKTTRTYDAFDNVITSTDPDGKQTGYAYDALNRLIQATSPDGGVTKASFDTAGNVSSRTDANERVTTYEYDRAGRRTKVTDPLDRAVQYEYDPDGNRTKIVNARGQSITSAYDPRGLLTSTTYSDGSPEVTYTHDDAGRLASVSDGTGWRGIFYDAADRPVKIYIPESGNPFQYTYRDDGSISGRTYPDGRATSYTYDADGRMTRQQQNNKNTNYTYDQAGNLLTTVLPTTPAVTETRTYDRAGLLASISEGAGARRLTRDSSGRVTAEALETGGTTGLPKRFAYDDAGRLTRACTDTTDTESCLPGSQGESYTYDKAGNRLTATSGTSTTTNTYDAADQLTQSTTGTTVTTLAYDADGNQTKDASGTYAYDAPGRMKSATIGTHTFTFAYDADGNRTSVEKNGTLHRTSQWDVNNGIPRLATERDGAGTLLGDYHYGPQGEPQAFDIYGASFWFRHDPQNSVTSVIDQAGAQTYRYTYGTWGTTEGTAGTGNQQQSAFGFNGAPKDSVLGGRVQLPARSYDPGSGRFTTPDPRQDLASPANSSTYAYSNNDPVNQSDPTGACPICVSIGVGALVGGVVEGGIYSWQHRNEGFTLGGLAKAAGKGALIGGIAGALMPGAGNIAVRSLGLAGGRALAASTAVNAGVGAGYSYTVNEAQCQPTDRWDLLLGAGGGAISSLMGPAVKWFRGKWAPRAESSGTVRPGELTNTAKNPSASEVSAAEHMASLGKKVELRDPVGTRAGGQTSDLLVDGVPWDVYSPTTTNPKAILTKVAKKHSQVHGGGVIVDLSGTGLSASQFDGALVRVNGLIRSWGKDDFISEVLFFGGS